MRTCTHGILKDHFINITKLITLLQYIVFFCKDWTLLQANLVSWMNGLIQPCQLLCGVNVFKVYTVIISVMFALLICYTCCMHEQCMRTASHVLNPVAPNKSCMSGGAHAGKRKKKTDQYKSTPFRSQHPGTKRTWSACILKGAYVCKSLCWHKSFSNAFMLHSHT